MNGTGQARYVRLAPGAAEAVAPFLGVAPDEIGELLLELESWPEEVRSRPRRARDGRLLEGDPVLVGAGPGGLVLDGDTRGVVVGWEQIASVSVLE